MATIIEKLRRFFASFKNKWLITAVILTVVLFILQSIRKTIKYEGFQQKEPFTVERGINVYDDFYVEIYDRLYKTESQAEKDAIKIIEATQPDKNNSVFLDIGCGTGCLVDSLKRRGYSAVGIDQSKSMIEMGINRRSHTCGNGTLRIGDANDPMAFDRGVFTHILCINRTIYEFEDKIALFRNCKYWIRPGGYFVLHLVEPDKYSPIVPLGKPNDISLSLIKNVKGDRVTDTSIDFIDFKYKSTYDFSRLTNGVVVQTETFTDVASNNVRQNEHTLYMSGSKSILEDARYCGFLLMGEFVDGEDKEQKVYILKSI